MPDQSVVEELLEKGARAVSPHAWDDDNGWTPDTYADVQGHARAIAGLVADAMFPGWREGITREWATELPGYGSWEHRSDEAAAREQATNGHMRLLARWVGPWVPVEEGTDG